MTAFGHFSELGLSSGNAQNPLRTLSIGFGKALSCHLLP
jgi:hypothetical protein